ncbi:hypothetical protein EQZ23_18425 [Sphingomonas sp. UV9]|uniref:hypothetical protein n=1 Tax=Sphingomonas sp. UV9 TaxID=1851410 RepID=UPI000FFCA9D9|nr:hypothetical protein [Sphingomonas sp. UV9]RXD02125.1 hypothetical protein EQZ23_18425 [Sphingomonas sp. UV9]
MEDSATTIEAAPATSPGDDCRAGIDRACCIGFDRIIDTDLPIEGTRTAPEPLGGNEDEAIRICWGRAIPVPTSAPPIWSLAEDGLHFAAPGVAEYRCTPTRIDVIPIEGAPQDMIEALLIATALPAALWLQGDFMIHAAAVIPHDRTEGALAIAGPSGSGKSRLAAAFMARGAFLVADDSVAVRQAGSEDASRQGCAGLSGGYHLWIQGGEGTRAFHPVADARARRSARLAAVVVLDDGSRASRTRLGAIEAVEALLANRHRPSVPRHCGLEPRSLRDAVRLAQRIPVYRWPRDDADALLDDAVRRAIMPDHSTGQGGTR